MSRADHQALLATLEARFSRHATRHPHVTWSQVASRLTGNTGALDALHAMETTGGEPDVVPLAGQHLLFCDCAAESPTGRRSLCYDRDARVSRKENAPVGSAEEMAAQMGVRLMTEAEYHLLQQHGAFDLKTSSWLATPPAVRALGGAIFGDRRYDRVFVYHNGAQSYYAARGFRGVLALD